MFTYKSLSYNEIQAALSNRRFSKKLPQKNTFTAKKADTLILWTKKPKQRFAAFVRKRFRPD